MKTRHILMTITSLSLMAFASSAMALEAAPIPCETDADCEAEKQVCIDGTCGWLESEAASCESDTDCDDGSHCVWSSCTEVGTYCMTDDDCGEYMKCGEAHFGSGSSSSSGGMGMTPTETDTDGDSEGGDASADMFVPAQCKTDDECGDEETCVDGYCEWSEESSEPTWEEPSEDWGMCTLDPDQVPTDATCAAMCEHVGSCMGMGGVADDVVISETTEEASSTDSESSGDAAEPTAVPVRSCEIDDDCMFDDETCVDETCQGGSGDDDGMHIPPPAPSEEDLAEVAAMCTAMCSYTVIKEVGLDELNTLAQCLEDNADSEDECAGMEACEGEADAWGQQVEASGIADELSGSMGGVGSVGSSASDDQTSSANGSPEGDDGTALGTSDDDAEGAEGADNSDDATPSGDSGGCGTSHSPIIPWLVLMSLGAAALLRRRQTA